MDEESQDVGSYEDIKGIIKELLFNGANRTLTAKFSVNPEEPNAAK